jgi:hypothetical protein
LSSESLNDYVRLTPYNFHFNGHPKKSLITIDSNLKKITLELPVSFNGESHFNITQYDNITSNDQTNHTNFKAQYNNNLPYYDMNKGECVNECELSHYNYLCQILY